VTLLPVVDKNLNLAIAKYNMKIRIRRGVVKRFTIKNHLFLGQLAKRIILGMVRNVDINEVPTSNPFDFRHFSLSKLECSIDGKTMHNKAFTPNFTDGELVRSYMPRAPWE
jgi:hypothetical protein